MMKAQENLIDMVKKVSERVEVLEKGLQSSSESAEVKRIPPELSVRMYNN